MNRTLITLTVVLLLTTFAQAQDATTTTAPATQPAGRATQPATGSLAHQAKNPIALENQFNSDMQKLKIDYQRQEIAITQTYVDGLKLALQALAQQENANPDDIAKLADKIKEVQTTIPNATQQSYIDGLKAALKALAQKENPDPDEIANLVAKIKEAQTTPSNAAQLKRISGEWNASWDGGSAVRTFKANGVVISTENGGSRDNRHITWVQNGSKVVIYYPGASENLTLSSDGKTMRGLNTNNQEMLYTFVGDEP